MTSFAGQESFREPSTLTPSFQGVAELSTFPAWALGLSLAEIPAQLGRTYICGFVSRESGRWVFIHNLCLAG